MALGGYADKVAWVDLTTGKTEFKPIPEEYKMKLDKSGAFNNPIVTEISPISEFYPAESIPLRPMKWPAALLKTPGRKLSPWSPHAG